jgi:RNase P/RNase MRP subunit p29
VNLIGARVKVVGSDDPSKRGLTGKVALETANTLLLDSGSRTLRVEKSGLVFQVLSTGTIISGEDIEGRLEDRWGGRRR